MENIKSELKKCMGSQIESEINKVIEHIDSMTRSLEAQFSDLRNKLDAI